MKKSILTLSLIASLVFVYSCKSGQEKENTEETPVTETTSSSTDAATVESAQPTNEPKTYTIIATPDTALLGKEKEAFIKIKDIKAIELSDPDGKSEGMELTYKIELTNKKAIGNSGSSVGVNTSHFRLELDNGQKIAPASIYVSAQPEETKTSDEDKFKIPAGAKPVGLSLFMDDTRASVKLELK